MTPSSDDLLDAAVIGAGPAGLATSRELGRRGVRHVVLERGDDVGTSWRNAYDSLTLHTGKHMSALPGLSHGRRAPLFLRRDQFVRYLERYRERFDLPVITGCEVRRAARHDGEWRLETTTGPIRARTLVLATGIMANPLRPRLPGEQRFGGTIIHSVEYRRPEPYRGRRVLVVGVGNSGGEIASELAGTASQVLLSVRSGANVVPLRLFGLPIQYAAYMVGKLPPRAQSAIVAAVRKLTELRRGPPVLPPSPVGPLDSVPLIGFHLVDAIHAGGVEVRGAVRELEERSVQFEDGSEAPVDDIILATGFGAAVRPLGEAARLDEGGFVERHDRVVATDTPGLYVVGHNYDATGGLFNIRRDAPLAARLIADEVA